MHAQRRGRVIAMSTAELDAFLGRERTCRLGLAEPERLMAGRYFGSGAMIHDGRHAWLRVTPRKITSWDFRKLATLPSRG
jgi:hypothetical protein